MKESVVRMHRTGDAGVLALEDAELGPPGRGEVRVRHRYSGVNFVDVYHRTGLYPLPALPAVPGVEAVGLVEALGEGVAELAPGDRVAYAGPPVGSYATARNFPAARLVRVPDGVADETAAGALLRGITAHMLFAYVRELRPGETVLVHAAAGGLGLVLVQWAKSLGATVIGTVGNADKAALARRHGLDHAIVHREQDFVAEVNRLTGGEGVHYAIDGIGGDTLPRTFAAVRPFGMVASTGQVAGPIAPIDPATLGRSVAFARPSVFGFVASEQRYREGATEALSRMAAGLRVPIDDVLPLAQAAEAHRRLESGRTSGSLVLETRGA